MSPSASEVLELDGGAAELPGWVLVEVGGRHRERFLASQVTSDLGGLADGDSQLSALLDRSGRLQAFFFLRRRADSFDLLIPEAVAEHCLERLESHIIADDVVLSRREVGDMRLVLGPAAVAMAPHEDRFPVSGWGSRGFVTWRAEDLALPVIPDGELEAIRVLGGPPVWDRELGSGQLVNETTLVDTAVSFDKGCYLGQETVSKVASHRGAVRGPVLLEIGDHRIDVGALVGSGFTVGERERAGEVLSAARWRGKHYLWVSLHRELRVIGRGLRAVFADGSIVDAVIRRHPLLDVPSREELADRLTVAASAAFADDRTERALELLQRAVAVCPTWADAHESLGVILGRLGRHREAVSRMQRLLEIDETSVMAHSNLSLFFNQLGDIERAEHHLAMASRVSLGGPAESSARETEAAEADRRRREEMFRRVLEIDPDDPLAHFGLGELAVERSRYSDAVKHLEKTIVTDPDHAAAILALGTALEGLGETEGAREIYERGIRTAAKKGDTNTAQKMQERITALTAPLSS